jgi:hypothetical protein
LKDRITNGAIVSECLPVRSFGNHSDGGVKVATVGLNPALNEFGSIGGWKPKPLRLPMVADYKCERANLIEADLTNARTRRENYFSDTARKPHAYFERLSALLHNVNDTWSYKEGSVVHCDLVACATKDAWSNLSARVASKLAENCRQHFLNTLAEIPSGARLLLNGSFVLGELCRQGIYLRLDRGPESICNDPLLIGWRGAIVLRSRTRRLFCAWNVPASYLKPQQSENLACWLRRHCL